MQFINKNSESNCEITEEQSLDIQERMHNMGVLLTLMHDYCCCNAENIKIYPLITVIKQLKLEVSKIMEVF